MPDESQFYQHGSRIENDNINVVRRDWITEGPEGSSNIDALSPLLILSKLLEPHEKTNCGVGNLGEGLLGVRCPWAFA
ncbi:MAG: hypothetical protein Q9203_001264 [Teloschistes exilis]